MLLSSLLSCRGMNGAAAAHGAWGTVAIMAASLVACGGDLNAETGSGAGGGTTSVSSSSSSGGTSAGVPVLTHVSSTEMAVGTHRPELRVSADGRIVVVVVQPTGTTGEGQVKHQAYLFNAELEQQGSAFTVSQTAAPYGEPADHRATIVGGEVFVVYQTLNYEAGSPPGGGGPSEAFATDQSLMLARFDLNGTELFRGAIVAQESDFSVDNFPDHCILWADDRLLVSTGTQGPTLKIREVDEQAQVRATHELTASERNIAGTIGNSMYKQGGELMLASSSNPNGSAMLTVSRIDADYQATQVATYADETYARSFPTDSWMLGDYTLMAFLERPHGGDQDLQNNPYGPRLFVLDNQFEVVTKIEIGEQGFAHVHPTMAVLDEQLYLAWSRQSDSSAPQVIIERYALSWE